MYGLKQAAILAHEQLIQHLTPYGYRPIPNTNFWKHVTKPMVFCLCVDDFGVKYFSKDDANHLFTALKTQYTLLIGQAHISADIILIGTIMRDL